MAEEALHSLPQGCQLQEYRIDDILGEGGFGITYLATDTNLGFAVAIKEYFPFDWAVRNADHNVVPRSQQIRKKFQWGLERFLEEANRLAQFRGHPNIVRVNRVIRENQTAYFVMEYEEGESLHAVLEREAPMEEDRLRFLISEVLDGLAEVHSREILHRDIKPDNIYVREDGVPVLLDFGSARRDQRSKALTGIVAEGYSPLEQYASDSENQGVWSDIYALGATIYHAISGAAPPPSPRRRLKDAMIPAAEIGAGQYDADFLDAVDWALGITPEQRPPDVETWREALFTESDKTEEEDADDVDDDGDFEDEEEQDEDDRQPYKLAADAVPVLQKRADEGEADAQFELGEAHEYGWIDGASDSLAAHYYRLAAEQDHTEAQKSLGDCYLNGTGVPEEDTEAAIWYRRAAQAGHAMAQYEIAYMYQTGQGALQKNAGTAANYYRKSADQGNYLSKHYLAELYEHGSGVAQDLARAVELYREVAEADRSFGQYDLGRMLEHGLGTVRDIVEALKWYNLAAEDGDSDAQYALARLYAEGDDVAYDLDEALAWLNRAVDAGSDEAQKRLDEYEAGDLMDFDADDEDDDWDDDWDDEDPSEPDRRRPSAGAMFVDESIDFLKLIFGFIWFKPAYVAFALGWFWLLGGVGTFALRYVIAGGFYVFGDEGWNSMAVLDYSGEDGLIANVYDFWTLTADRALNDMVPGFYGFWSAEFEIWTGWHDIVVPVFSYLHMGLALWALAILWLVAWAVPLLPLNWIGDKISYHIWR